MTLIAKSMRNDSYIIILACLGLNAYYSRLLALIVYRGQIIIKSLWEHFANGLSCEELSLRCRKKVGYVGMNNIPIQEREVVQNGGFKRYTCLDTHIM